MSLSVAKEGNNYSIKVTFKDKNGVTMIPLTAMWSLRNNLGSIVNSRSDVPITPATTVSILLTPADLVYEANSSTMRTFTVEGTYNGEDGDGLSLADETTFDITNLVGV